MEKAQKERNRNILVRRSASQALSSVWVWLARGGQHEVHVGPLTAHRCALICVKCCLGIGRASMSERLCPPRGYAGLLYDIRLYYIP